MDIGKGISQSFDLYRKNVGVLLAAGFLTMIISCVTIGILAGPLFGGLLILCRKLLKGEKAEIGEIFAHFDKFVPALLLTLIIFVPTMIVACIPFLGALVMFFAGPIINLVYSFGLIMIIEKNKTFMDALRDSFELIKPNVVMNWVYAFVINILGSIGVILVGIGIILTLPISPLGLCIAYNDLTNSSSQVPPANVAPGI